MKIRFSPLISGMAGRTADLVAASWKGIAYVRKWVIPANPQTAAQTAVRNSLARCVTLWRSLPTAVKSSLDAYGTTCAMSGYNVFMRFCRALEQTASALVVHPYNPHVPAPPSFAAATGIGVSGDIDCSWTDDALTGYTKQHIFVRETTVNVFSDFTLVDAADDAEVIGGLTPAKSYDVYSFRSNADGDVCGTCACTQGVSPKA